MTWWKDIDGTRLLIAPDSSATGNNDGHLLSLRHPKTGHETCYLFVNGVLQELNWLKQSYRSWFLWNYISEDGCIYAATTIDPVFLFLPIFEEARLKKADCPGKFRSLDEIIFIDGYPGYQHLLPLAENCMQVVCEIKEIGSSKYFRLDDTKVLAWLYCKVSKLKQTLPLLDKNYAAQDEKDALTSTVSILGEYVKDEPWLSLLCDNLNLNLPNEKAPKVEVFPCAMESNVGSSTSLQEKSRSDKKSNRTGKQAKKVKLETESQNIKEMFCRASRSRS
ncbi:ribonuclease H2 subunit B [Melia azedarach]|uniref:Ribonuclease H2 subunit B n=1 Tax=Melia azedarach TaxID=155640 RepID=A0ACC1YDD4_MELAZ|nr:ribonuclease H2 subunit B [Melia azedarach]